MIKYAIYCLLFLQICSCSKSIIEEDSSANVFDVFWTIMDERYVFFEEKNINWDSIYSTYTPLFGEASNEEMKTYFNSIIQYIEDGHVSIKYNRNENSTFDFSGKRHIKINQNLIFYRYNMSNFSIHENVTLAQMPDSILYFSVDEMLYDVDIDNIENSLSKYNYQKGVIIDVRDNGGGSATSLVLSSFFFEGNEIIYYDKYKTGEKRNSFSDFIPIQLAGKGTISKQIPIILNCNSNTYSGGNFFSYILSNLENCTVVGEESGGGGGVAREAYLPNGWILRLTQTKSYDANKVIMEDGLVPDIEVLETDSFWVNVQNITGEDPQLQCAIDLLSN